MTSQKPDFDVVIVGAGFAGMHLLHRFRAMGLRVRVVEAGSGVGGTWYWNRYPGARCDVESLQYSFQFDAALQQEWDWSERFASQPEILKYAEHVAERFDLVRDIQFDTRVQSAVFDGARSAWVLTSEAGVVLEAQFCVMATGSLSKPNVPPIEGLSDFAGPVYNTGTWPHSPVSFEGQRVGVLGTGSSGIQTIPQIAKQADHLVVMQRTANYSIPAHNRPADPEEVQRTKENYADLRQRAKMRLALIEGHYGTQAMFDVSQEERQAQFEESWAVGGLLFAARFKDVMLSKAANDVVADFVRAKIRETVSDPDVAELLCPKNIIGGKRICVDTDYFATYNRENVQLVDVKATPIERFVSTGVQIDGRAIPLDALVLATGFDAMTGALTSIDLRGTDKQPIKDVWQDGPSTYLGFAVAGFPNLFIVNGPGSPSVLSNMLAAIEQQVEWITDCIGYVSAKGARVIEARQDAQDAWWAHCQELGDVGIKTTTDSWYLGANIEGKARVIMPYMGGYPAYSKKCEAVAAADYEGFRMS